MSSKKIQTVSQIFIFMMLSKPNLRVMYNSMNRLIARIRQQIILHVSVLKLTDA